MRELRKKTGLGPIVDRVWALVKKKRERKAKVEKKKGLNPDFIDFGPGHCYGFLGRDLQRMLHR
jgi:hypothetical protein